MGWLLGLAIAIDKMTMGYYSPHQDKRRITYKAEGNGFQVDTLGDKGYCYQFYIRNNPQQF